jgi:hypothetical protein
MQDAARTENLPEDFETIVGSSRRRVAVGLFFASTLAPTSGCTDGLP